MVKRWKVFLQGMVIWPWNICAHDTLSICFEMAPRIVSVKDVYFPKEPLRAIECGPLLFAFRFPENWKKVAGTPLTPLPQGWSWYEASFVSEGKPPLPFYSLDLKELNGGTAIVKQRSESAYPWDDSPFEAGFRCMVVRNRYTARRTNTRALLMIIPLTPRPKPSFWIWCHTVVQFCVSLVSPPVTKKDQHKHCGRVARLACPSRSQPC